MADLSPGGGVCGSSSSLAPRLPAQPAQEADKHAESLDGDLNEVRCQPSAAPTHTRALSAVWFWEANRSQRERECL